MRIKTTAVSCALLALLCHGGCKKSPGTEERGYSALNPRTRIVRSGSYELAFELMTMERHEQMMRQMNLTMQHDTRAPYVLMLTVIDKKADRLVRDAIVEFELEQFGQESRKGADMPPKKPSVPPRIVRAMNMPGEKMFHYAADFPYSAPGIYQVRTTIRRAGSPTVRQPVEFEL